MKEYLAKTVDIHKFANNYCYKRFLAMGLDSTTPKGSFYLTVDFENFRSSFIKKDIYTSDELCEYLIE